MIPVVSSDPAGPAVLPTPDSWQWFAETGRTRAPAWRNEVTLRSVELFLAYEPGAYIEYVSPTPLLLVVALGDHLTVADEALAASEEAGHAERRALRCVCGRFRQGERCGPRLVRRAPEIGG